MDSDVEQTKRAKEMYPVREAVFRAAVMEYNDYDNGIIRTKTNCISKYSICRQNGEACHQPRAVSVPFSATPESSVESPRQS